MEIVVTHLTRMQYPRICVAGVDTRNRQRHIRPVTPPWRTFTHEDTQTFRLGNIVELFDPLPRSTPPEVEDMQVLQWQVRGTLPAEEFVAILQANVRPSLEDIFGPWLMIRRGKPTIPVGKGEASLGIIEPEWLKVSIVTSATGKQQLRCLIRFPSRNELYNLSLTDLRFYRQREGQWHPDPIPVQESLALQQRSKVLVSVGVTRPWAPPDEDEPCHWLQINNIHHLSEPYWRR